MLHRQSAWPGECSCGSAPAHQRHLSMLNWTLLVQTLRPNIMACFIGLSVIVSCAHQGDLDKTSCSCGHHDDFWKYSE